MSFKLVLKNQKPNNTSPRRHFIQRNHTEEIQSLSLQRKKSITTDPYTLHLIPYTLHLIPCSSLILTSSNEAQKRSLTLTIFIRPETKLFEKNTLFYL